MRKLRRLLFRLLSRLLGLALLIFVPIFLYKTFTLSSRQIHIDPIEKIGIADSVALHLAKAIKLPTISTPSDFDSLAFYNLDTLMTQTFPLVDSLLEKEMVNEFSMIYRWPGLQNSLPPILLLAHLDVVPIENKATWTEPPFGGSVKNGYIYGRGALDDKMSAYGALEAVEMLLKEEYQPQRTVYLAFGHDEEVGGEKGAISIAKLFEQRGIEFEYILDEGQVILENALSGLDRPLAMIGLAEKGYATLTLEVNLEHGGHSSMPPTQTAVGILSAAINTLQDNPFPTKINGATSAFFEYIAPEMTLFNKALFANLWATKGLIINQLKKDNAAVALLRTTTAPTILEAGVKDNVLPTKAKAKVNFRILPGETVESVQQYVQEIIADERIKAYLEHPEFSSNPTPVSSLETFGFQTIQRTAQEVFPDVVVAPSLVIATTDARHYSAVSKNIYRFSPMVLAREDLKRIHGSNEKISVENYQNMIRFYRQLFLNSCE